MKKEHTYTLGIEEEFAIVDPETRELRSHIQEILEGGKVLLKEQIKPEMHQSVVELGTEICTSIENAREHVVELRSKLASLANKANLRIASVGTHPFSNWHDQLITEGERYKQIVKDMQRLARANLIFGLHVHVGIPSRESAIHVMNQAVIAKLYKLLKHNTTFRVYRRRLLDENRWRASRYGIGGKLIDFGRETEVETRSLLNELMEFVSTEVDELGSRREMAHIERIMREGTGADRQLEVFHRTNDMNAVVDQIVAETYEGLKIEDASMAPV